MATSEIAFIYTLSDPRTNEVRYVGVTYDIKQRFYYHVYSAKHRRTTKNHCWVFSLLNQGISPLMEIIEEIKPESGMTWQEAEIFWIETLRFYGCNLNNLTAGGRGGLKPSKEVREKISQSRIGFTHKAETKARISASSKARMTDAEKEHLRQVNLASGFTHTEETKEIIRQSKIGKKRPAHVVAALQAGRKAWKEKRIAAGLPIAPHTIKALQSACR